MTGCELLLDAVDFGLIVVDADGLIAQANRWVCDRARPGRAIIGQPLAQAFAQAPDPRLMLSVRSCLDLGNAVRLSQAFHPMPLPLYLPGEGDKPRLRQSVDILALPAADGAARRCLIQVRDVSESVRREQLYKSQARRLQQELARLTEAHREIERQSARFREMARLAPVGLFETDADGRLSYCNARVAELLGVDTQPLQQRPWTELFSLLCRDIAVRHRAWQAAAASGVRYVDEICLERPQTSRAHWLRVEATPVRPSAGEASTGHIFTVVDVTELREQARRNELRANHDKLTGLANRDRFEAALQDRLQRLAETAPDALLTVMFIDLDRFKRINDTHGHHAGDLVLKTVAGRIRRCVRSVDVVARLGGDEFAVLLPEPLPPEVVERVAARIDKAVSMPINIGSCHVQVGASVGWSTARAGACRADVAALLQAADAEMYRHKRERMLQPAAPLPAPLAAVAATPRRADAQAA